MGNIPLPSDADKELGGKVRVDVVDYSMGQVIINEGDPGDGAFILLQGEVEVFKMNQYGRSVTIAVLGPNEIFGEMSLFEGKAVRSASVRVVSERAQAMMISKDYFDAQLQQMPDGVRSIIQVLVNRLRQADARLTLMR